MIYYFKLKCKFNKGDWEWGIGDWGLAPIPNPQSPIPNPQSPIPNPLCFFNYNYFIIFPKNKLKYNT